jgi:hypothetical protein
MTTAGAGASTRSAAAKALRLRRLGSSFCTCLAPKIPAHVQAAEFANSRPNAEATVTHAPG